jgi:amino acid adenylation domain-containing protein
LTGLSKKKLELTEKHLQDSLMPDDCPKNLCIQQLFEMQAKRTPHACAVIFKQDHISYEDLNRLANRLAWKLIELGVTLDEGVGICAERSIETIVGILAILKAGAACLPLDPDYPKERLAFMLRDGGVRFLLLDDQFVERLPENETTVIGLDNSCRSGKLADANPPNLISPDNLAYVIYTSGSTGKPKGVEVAHRGIVRLLFGIDYVNLDETKALLQLSALTFDGSIFDIWGALLHGGRSVLYPGRVPIVRELGELLREHKVTTAWLTTALFNAIVDEDPSVLATLKQILVGGEALSVSHIRRAWAYLPNVEIINAYGPTEATVFACSYRIPTSPAAIDTSIPIGRPIGNTRAYILDENLHPAPLEVSGELYLGGPGVARGYRNQPELTAQRFIPDPFGKDPRLYRTGDLARYRPDGNIEFLGRIDNQVKIRGFRIELGEIEEVSRRHESVRDAAVVVNSNINGERLLSLFVVPKPDTQLSSNEILIFLRQNLPLFMVPSRCHVLDRWPLTSSGKVDRQALAALGVGVWNQSADAVPPRTPLEQQLAKIWEQLLNVRPIGIRDSFSDLGGNSLLAVRLFAKIEKQFGKRLPVPILLSSPTIEQLAGLLTLEEPRERLAYARPIQPKGEEPPFFCVGAGLLLRPLSIELGPSQPFVSIGLEPGAADQLMHPYRMEELARHLVLAVRERQPQGPYYLGGWCHDGLFAYEVAQQLIQQNQEIGLLVLFETDNPSQNTQASIRTGLKRIVMRLKDRRRQLQRLTIGEAPIYACNRAKEVRQFLTRTRWRISRHFSKFKIASRPSGEQILYLAAISYQPKPSECSTVLFRAKEAPIASGGDPYLGWHELLTGSCEIYEIPGDHAGIFSEPNVKVLAQQMRICLNNAKLANTELQKQALPEDRVRTKAS